MWVAKVKRKRRRNCSRRKERWGVLFGGRSKEGTRFLKEEEEWTEIGEGGE